ncbi:MAG: cytochrome-c peroxidase [Deltaproteobacteria bacterium]|nr:cytochrome-c peroxidase [Deltaproteobacteria bacterium]
MAEVELGRRLYFDPILSGDGTVSCSSCHSLDHGGAEDRRTSTGIGGHIGPINAPSVLNAGFNFRQFWDGRAEDLQDQAGGPVENPGEMGATFGQVIPRIQADEWYAARFAQVFPGGDPVTKEHITHAIAEYERSLVTPSPVDRYLGGDASALNEQQRRGYALFKSTGCAGCHSGVNVGGGSYQKMGLVEDYFALRGGEQTDADLGRFNVTHDEADRHKFKVPTLRNVAESGPYFHDGSQAQLADAVRIMARVQLGKTLSDTEVTDLVAFLGALTGELPAHARLPADQAPPSRATPSGAAEQGATGTTAE